MGIIELLVKIVRDVGAEIAPRHSGDITGIMAIVVIVVAIISRKQFGGCLKALWSIFWMIVFLYILECISPALMWIFIIGGIAYSTLIFINNEKKR